MSSDITEILSQWNEDKDQDWVLATLIKVEGSSYRKPGAMMLVNGLGQYYGMLSGGCLEADIVLKSGAVMNEGKPRVIRYDMTDETSVAWQLGIGCGGCIDILLQPVTKENQYLALDQLLEKLSLGQECQYLQGISEQSETILIDDGQQHSILSEYTIIRNGTNQWFVNVLKPNPHIVIFGGGIDAIPLTKFCNELNWKVTLCDPRSTYARKKYFSTANHIVKDPIPELAKQDWIKEIDAVVIMHHNIKLDAQALELVQTCKTHFVGMLGPAHRTKNVIEKTTFSNSALVHPLHNPIGLNLGGDTPSSIALSIVAQIQAVLNQTSARSLGVYTDVDEPRKKQCDRYERW